MRETGCAIGLERGGFAEREEDACEDIFLQSVPVLTRETIVFLACLRSTVIATDVVACMRQRTSLAG